MRPVPVYLDFNATTPLDPAVLEAMQPALRNHFGNPSSVHQIGRFARILLDDSRERLASLWQCKPSEIVFTSGGTESNALAVLGTARALRQRGRHLVCSSIEHHAVLHAFEHLAKREGFAVTFLPVSPDGIVTVDAVAAAVTPHTSLVSVMAANNETGSLQPVAAIGELCRRRGLVFHTDAAQWFGKEPVLNIHQFNADLVSVCAHKLHGPKGAGALFIRSPLKPEPLLFGGGHEHERRAGTENLAAILGLTEALARFAHPPVFASPAIFALAHRLDSFLGSLGSLGVTVRGPALTAEERLRLVNTVAFTVRGCDSPSLVAALDLEGFCVSSGSACSSGSLAPSHVLKAMGVPDADASSLIRVSLGRSTTEAEIAAFEEVLPEVVLRGQRFNNFAMG